MQVNKYVCIDIKLNCFDLENGCVKNQEMKCFEIQNYMEIEIYWGGEIFLDYVNIIYLQLIFDVIMFYFLKKI